MHGLLSDSITNVPPTVTFGGIDRGRDAIAADDDLADARRRLTAEDSCRSVISPRAALREDYIAITLLQCVQGIRSEESASSYSVSLPHSLQVTVAILPFRFASV